jgi:hypothetical protein
MKGIALTFMGLVAFIVILALSVWLWGFLGFMEGKAIFSTLQGLEFKHRDERLQTPQIFGTYPKAGPVVVVSTFDKHFPYAWIAATIPSCADDELCMVGGDARIDIKCSDEVQLETQIRNSSFHLAQPIQALLRNACRD